MTKLNPKTVAARRRKLHDIIDKATVELRELRSRCSHVGTLDYEPDPSGNNDSSYDCSACGASFRSWPKDVPRT